MRVRKTILLYPIMPIILLLSMAVYGRKKAYQEANKVRKYLVTTETGWFELAVVGGMGIIYALAKLIAFVL